MESENPYPGLIRGWLVGGAACALWSAYAFTAVHERHSRAAFMMSGIFSAMMALVAIMTAVLMRKPSRIWDDLEPAVGAMA
jgi:hypothetical protein